MNERTLARTELVAGARIGRASAAARPAHGVAWWAPRLVALVLWPAMALVLIVVTSLCGAFRRSAMRGALLFAALAIGAAAASQVDASPRVARDLVNAPFTGAGVAWGLTHGGTLHLHDGMLVVEGMSGGYGPRGGITIGSVFLTKKDPDNDASVLRDELIAHESRHADQWAALGLGMPPLYLLSNLIGGGADGNVFEVAAGLQDGGYVPA